MRRTAVLLDITRFGELGAGEPDPHRPKPLPFGEEVTRLGAVLSAFGYEIVRPRGPGGLELTGAEMSAQVEAMIADHGPKDVVLVHVMSHGYPDDDRVDSLYVLGSDGTVDRSADVVQWIRRGLSRADGPHVLFTLDVCFAGQAVGADALMRRSEPERVWILAASGSGQSAFGARFTTALAAALSSIRSDYHAFGHYFPYIRLGEIARRVKVSLAAEDPPQNVTGSRVSLSTDDALPFFANPGFTMDAVEQPETRRRPVDELDHFSIAAECRAPDDREGAGFTGRATQLRALSSWLNDATAGPLLVVTGRKGVGKSALLGVFVCAAHQELDRPVLDHLPDRHDRFAAVHARHRDTSGLVGSLAAQLFGVEGIHTVRALADRITQDGRCYVVVVDALDEAVDAGAVLTHLLLPLTKAGCRVLVASRGGADVTIAACTAARGAVVDLDQADRRELRGDLTNYATALLDRSEPRFDSAFADTVAIALTTGARAVWGEFLVTRLYLRHVIGHVAPDLDPLVVGAAVPRDAAVFELDPQVRRDGTWMRPVLAALALARGDGMPTRLAGAIAGACAGLPDARPDDAEVAAVLIAADSYLQLQRGEDGIPLYQVFHQGVGALLTEKADLVEVYRALLRTVPLDEQGKRDWSRANAYVRRHVLSHALDAGKHGELLSDPGYLLSDFPEPAEAVAELASVVDVRAARAVIANRKLPPRQLAVEAVLRGGAELARALSGGLLRPVFAAETAVEVGNAEIPAVVAFADSRTVHVHDLRSGAPLAEFRQNSDPVAMDFVRFPEGLSLAVGRLNGVVSVCPIIGEAAKLEFSHDARLTDVRSVGGVVVTRGSGVERLWDAVTGELRDSRFYAREPEIVRPAVVWCVHRDAVGGRPVVAAGLGFGGVLTATFLGSGDVRVEPGAVTFHVGEVREISLLCKDDWAAVVVRDGLGRCRAWHPKTGAPLIEWDEMSFPDNDNPVLIGDRLVLVRGREDGAIAFGSNKFVAHEGPVRAVSAWRRGSVPLAVSCGLDGLRVWDLTNRSRLDHLPMRAIAIEAVPPHHVVVWTDDRIIIFECHEEKP